MEVFIDKVKDLTKGCDGQKDEEEEVIEEPGNSDYCTDAALIPNN